MKFFHVYNDQYYEGLVKNDLIDEDTGFKLQHCFAVPDELQFNRFAAKGSRFYNMIREKRYPFYVDRVAGGVTYYPYEFDGDLIKEYKELLGEWFLGFQQHETAGNRSLDWNRVLERMEGEKGPYADPELLASRSIRSYARRPDGTVLWGFSQGSPYEYAALPFPETVEELYEDFYRLFRSRMEATGNSVLPCDSFSLLTKLQDEIGVENFMPEVGCQIPHMRIAVATARGVALAKGKKWGVYYECWKTTKETGATMPVFNKDPGNEWYLTQETHKDDFTTHGENGGSSRKLQRRIYHYALMSGAMFMGEEWGLNCSYNDMNSFELSPYGEAKKDFLHFARKHRKVKATIPFAIVLPKDQICIQLVRAWKAMGEIRTQHLRRVFTDDEARRVGVIEDVLKLLFQRDLEEICGDEGHVMQNSRFGDLFDLVYEDFDESAFLPYDTLIDLTYGGSFSKKYGGKFRFFENRSLSLLGEEIRARAKDILPMVADSCHWLLSEDENGAYFSIFNNEGNTRSVSKGDEINPTADRRVTVTLCEKLFLSPEKLSSDTVRFEKRNDDIYEIFLPATEFAIFKYETQSKESRK